MKQNLITDVVQGMLPYLNNAQTEKLQEVLQHTLFGYEVTTVANDTENLEQDLVELFLSAKRIEGCSEKTLKYYNATIQAMLTRVGKGVRHIVTDDVRSYLTEYQEKNQSSKVTIDNIRRILSSFFSWLEDEDYILKSPVRRIHKVKTGTNIKETYTDEALELMRDIQLPNTKIKILQRLLSQAIDEFKKVNKIMGVEFADRLKRVVDEYNNRRRDESYANEVLDDIAGKLADLLAELKAEKDSFKKLGIDYEEKAFYDILKAVAKKYEFDNEYPDEKMIELSKKIKVIVDDKSRYTDWSTRDDIKANLQVDLILLLDEYGYPPVTLDDVYKEVLEQAENFKKYAG